MFQNIINLFLKELNLNNYFNNIPIIEPCCGQGDLINFLKSKGLNNFELYDIDPKYINTIKQDTILNQPDYNNKIIITNPPYAAKNKLTKQQKELYKDYLNDVDDLYQIYIKQTINSNILLGILILPINFLFSESNKLSKEFIQKYQIIYANLFEKQVFNDTTSAICVIYFRLRQPDNNKYIFSANLIRKTENKNINIELSENNNYCYGNEVFKENNKYNIILTRYCKHLENNQYLTHIKIFTLDPNIKAIYDENPQLNLVSDRSLINIISSVKLDKFQEKEIIKRFNETLLFYREKYNSLFMASYREFSRKRLSFNLIYIWLKTLLI